MLDSFRSFDRDTSVSVMIDSSPNPKAEEAWIEALDQLDAQDGIEPYASKLYFSQTLERGKNITPSQSLRSVRDTNNRIIYAVIAAIGLLMTAPELIKQYAQSHEQDTTFDSVDFALSQ